MKKILFLVLLTISYGCRKNVIKVDKNFIGEWEAVPFTPPINSGDTVYLYTNVKYNISIRNSGRGTYSKDGEIFDKNKSGKWKIKGEKLWIGLMEFEIKNYPTYGCDSLSNCYYEMTIDNRVYRKLE